jgi:probable phosphoglycerate mutase
LTARQAEYHQRAFTLPPDATELVIVRHGASAAARPGERHEMLEGRGNPPLAETGVTQAAAVAERLRAEPLSALYVTPLQRTAQTAAPLAEATGLEPVVIGDLVEVSLGDWEGGEFRIRAQEGDPLVVRALAEERWDVLPGAEPPGVVAERVRRGVETVVERTGLGRSSVAVLHGGIIGEICRQATGSRPFAFIHADNGSITRLVVFADGRWMLRSFNDTAHLAAVSAGGDPRPPASTPA